MQTGWIGEGPLEELPAGQMARHALADVLQAAVAPTLADVRAEAVARRAREQAAADREDALAFAAFRGEIVARSAGEVTATAAERAGFADERASLERRQQAREILRAHGLEDQLEGRIDGIVDANLGYLETRRSGGRSMESILHDRQERKDAEAREERESVGLGSVSRARAVRHRGDPWMNWGR